MNVYEARMARDLSEAELEQVTGGCTCGCATPLPTTSPGHTVTTDPCDGVTVDGHPA